MITIYTCFVVIYFPETWIETPAALGACCGNVSEAGDKIIKLPFIQALTSDISERNTLIVNVPCPKIKPGDTVKKPDQIS